MLMNKGDFTGRYAFLHTGFRPFFILSGISGGALMLAWFAIFNLGQTALVHAYFPVDWHAHEMIYGFGVAVIAGFLLTAVRNWTHVQTIDGFPLLVLALWWLVVRIGAFLPGLSPVRISSLECMFLFGLFVAISHPVIKVRQWRQMGILVKVFLLIPSSLLFHYGVATGWQAGVTIGIYAGLYLELSLVLTVARRVMPMFIERGLLNGFVPRNRAWVDYGCLGVFLLFSIVNTWGQLSPENTFLSLVNRLLAVVLLILHSLRLIGWYHPAIWKKPMLWVLFLAYLWLIIGFLLEVLVGIWTINHSLALHALAAGGLGMMVVGMMTRVSLGHTGRQVNTPPRLVPVVFTLVGLSVFFRVLAPIWLPQFYLYWIGLSQLIWSISFILFAIIFTSMLFKARIDGLPG